MDHEELLQKIERLVSVVSGEMGDESERLEGLDQIARFIDPTMSRTRFYQTHRAGLTPYLMVRSEPWRKSGSHKMPRAKYFSYKRLILLYMFRRRLI
jgi:hypothetical protein